MALGSAPTEVLGMVMREAMTDALAIMGTVPTLLMVAAVASFIPGPPGCHR